MPYCSKQNSLQAVINEQDCRAIRTACCCLKSLRIRVEARVNVTERAVISRQLQLMQASIQHYPTEDLNTADTSCPSRTSAEHFDTRPGVQRMNARIPVPMWLSQQPWSTDRIEYNWLQHMHLLTNSLCTATLMLVHGTSAEHAV